MVLTVKDLACQRGGVQVLAGVSFTLAPGAVMELRGPNGIGKTTLLRTLTGLQPALAGEVMVDPEALAYSSHADGAKGALTVHENLDFWAEIYGQGDVSSALEAYELGPLAARLASHLSAGQRRRLGLARMLVTGRPLWLMDEPTVSLDRSSVDLFRTVLSAHVAAGGAAVIATHLDLGVSAETLDLGAFRAAPVSVDGAFDEAFL